MRPHGVTDLFLTSQPIDTGPTGDEPLGHAVAALDPRTVILASASLAGREERIRRFSQIFRSVPPSSEPAERSTQPYGVAVRSVRSGGQTYLSMANDTPYPIRVATVITGAPSAVIYDLNRSSALKPDGDDAGRLLVLDLPPFGTTAVRVGAAEAKIGEVKPYPSEVVMTAMQARYDDLSAKLSWLSRNPDKDKGNDKDADANRLPPIPGLNRDRAA